MARGLNKVLLIGNLGKDPEMKYTQGGTGVTQFSLAVSRTYKNKSGEQVDETEWFRVVAWDRLAEMCNEYLRKGSKVYIEGRLQTRKYTGTDGQERQITEVVASEMLLLDSRQGAGAGGAGGQAGYSNEGGSSGGRGGYNESRPPAATRPAPAYDEEDTDVDDIPF